MFVLLYPGGAASTNETTASNKTIIKSEVWVKVTHTLLRMALLLLCCFVAVFCATNLTVSVTTRMKQLRSRLLFIFSIRIHTVQILFIDRSFVVFVFSLSLFKIA